jgi:hypothetical protein
MSLEAYFLYIAFEEYFAAEAQRRASAIPGANECRAAAIPTEALPFDQLDVVIDSLGLCDPKTDAF